MSTPPPPFTLEHYLEEFFELLDKLDRPEQQDVMQEHMRDPHPAINKLMRGVVELQKTALAEIFRSYGDRVSLKNHPVHEHIHSMKEILEQRQ